MRKIILCALFALLIPAAYGASPEDLGTHIRYYGTGTNSGDILFTTGDISRYKQCSVMSTDGAVTVEVSLDGTNFSGALSIQDFGATTTDPVIVTAADTVYGFVLVGYRRIRLKQSGATASSASMNCTSS